MVETMGGTVSATVMPQAQQQAQQQQAEKQEKVVSEKVHKIEYKPDAPTIPAMVHAAILPVGGGAVRGPASGQSSGGLF